jgi:hypothetical protein
MSIGIKPGDVVLIIERRGEQQIVRNGLVASLSMREDLAGTRGEMAIEAAFISATCDMRGRLIRSCDVVHSSHRDWLEGRAGLAYELRAVEIAEGALGND